MKKVQDLPDGIYDEYHALSTSMQKALASAIVNQDKTIVINILGSLYTELIVFCLGKETAIEHLPLFLEKLEDEIRNIKEENL